ncbi:hypothetical protein [Rickettsia endosymbiont of Aspidapion aeneum]
MSFRQRRMGGDLRALLRGTVGFVAWTVKSSFDVILAKSGNPQNTQ